MGIIKGIGFTAKDISRKAQKADLYRLTLARSDVTAALFFTKELIEKKLTLSDRPFLIYSNAIVISYGRPFSENDLGKISGNFGKFGDSRLQATHNDLIEMRNKVVAHSDVEARKVHIYPHGSEIMPSEGPLDSLGVSISTSSFVPEKFYDIHDTCFNLGQRIEAKIHYLLDYIYGNLDLPKVRFPLKITEGF